jgi:uncharacterized membrane protein
LLIVAVADVDDDVAAGVAVVLLLMLPAVVVLDVFGCKKQTQDTAQQYKDK